MIVEALIGAGVLVAGTAAVRAFLRRRAERRREDDDDTDPGGAKRGKASGDHSKRGPAKADDAKDAGRKDAKDAGRKDARDAGRKDAKDEGPAPDASKRPRRRRAPPKRTGPRGLRVDDVLLYEDTELWLAGVLELDEEGFVARLFPVPGALRAEWVAQLDPEARDVAVLRTTDAAPAGAVPESLPVEGRRLTLERRGTAQITSDGEHLPRVEARGRYTLLSDAAGRILFVVDFDKAPRIALVGDRVSKHMLDLLPGGDPDED